MAENADANLLMQVAELMYKTPPAMLPVCKTETINDTESESDSSEPPQPPLTRTKQAKKSKSRLLAPFKYPGMGKVKRRLRMTDWGRRVLVKWVPATFPIKKRPAMKDLEEWEGIVCKHYPNRKLNTHLIAYRDNSQKWHTPALETGLFRFANAQDEI